ncbi:DEDD exonuclease domain-containing protein [Euzebya sp.]|uniref:DEDD exonuclease domain-containing protein n=1 Tax=Euzebya sp. TaxID=1971409 RepID=UPI0035167FB0
MFQPTLSDLGQPLADTTFVVVDLETTGGSPERDRITEIGAVKILGGELQGELASLVDPGRAVPTEITVLTGISDRMVEGRPPVSAVLPSFLEFARGAALVAHNARFDVGFLNAELSRLGYPRLDHPVVCTAQLARRLVDDEVRNRRLGTLARHFRSGTVPVHRALADARATVDVFHGLLERAGTFGVVTLEDLIAFSRVRNMPVFTSRRQMADDLPSTPGVYRFTSASGEVLYVGKATDLRARVRQYFGTDTRRRVRQLVEESARVDHTTTPTAVEAEIIEAREIRAARPRFNRRGKRVATPVWLALTTDAYPRLSVVRTAPRGDRVALGPLPSRQVADDIADAVCDALPIRRCTTRMAADTRFGACALAEMGRCLAPCVGGVDPDGYAVTADAVAAVLGGDVTPALEALRRRMAARAADGRFEEAAQARDRLDVLTGWVTRSRRDLALRTAGTVAASRPVVGGRREVLVQRAGWLLGTAVTDPGDVGAAVADLAARPSPEGTAPPDELAILQRWLAGAAVRVEQADEGLAWPVAGGADLERTRRQLTAAKARTGRPAPHLAAKRLVRG